MSSVAPIKLSVHNDPCLARLVRMTAANVAVLSSMSVERVEDIRMAAEEAFIYACSSCPDGDLDIAFDVNDERVIMTFCLCCGSFARSEGDPSSAYAELILGAVCDRFEKYESSHTLELELRADV